jgi:hypothetical protein
VHAYRPALLLLATLAGCGGAARHGVPRSGGAGTETAQPRPAAVRTCSMVGSGGLAANYRRRALVLGPLALGGLRTYSPRTPLPPARGARRGAYEVIAILAAGADVTITIPRYERSTVALIYDPGKFRDDGLYRVADLDHTMRLVACRSRRFNHGVSQFDGGFVVTRPQCVRLRVATSSGRSYRGRFPAGAPCPAGARG